MSFANILHDSCHKHVFSFQVVSASPCNCGMPPAPPPPPPPPASFHPKKAPVQRAPFIASSHTGKPCGKDDAECLCARACYPSPVTNANPCDCGMPAPPPPPPPQFAKASPAIAKSKTPACKKNDANCICARACYPRPVATATPCNCGAPAPPPPPPPSQFIQPLSTATKSKAPVCKKNDAKCICARACYPRPVAKASPCNCGAPPPPPPPPPAVISSSGAANAAVAPTQCAQNDAQCLCSKSCYPLPVARASPCNCGAPAPPPAPPPAQAVASTKKAPFNCKPTDGKCLCARACYPRPVARASPCNCGMPPPAPPPPPPAAPAVTAASTDAKSYTPAVSWCIRACKPRHVLSTSPCQCHPDEPLKAAVRQPKPVPKERDTPEKLCERTCHPRPVSSSNPCQCGVPAPGDSSHVYPLAAPMAPEAALKFPGMYFANVLPMRNSCNRFVLLLGKFHKI